MMMLIVYDDVYLGGVLILFDIGYRANLGGVLEGPPGVKVSSVTGWW